MLCNHLAGVGVIVKDGEELQLAKDAAIYLDKRSSFYLGSATAALYSTPLLRGFERLTEFVRGAESGEHAAFQPEWFDVGRGLTDQGAAIRAFVDAVVLPGGPLKILHAGAGDGLYGIALAERYPEAVIVAADRPASLKVAQQNAVRAKLRTRYQNIPGDLLTTEFGTGYDAVIFTGGLHRLDPEQIELLMKRFRDALKKNAQLFISEFLLEDGAEFAREYAGFALTMLTATRRGVPYSAVEVQDMLRSCGFVSAGSRFLPEAHATLVTARA